jgi:hypothetical protein
MGNIRDHETNLRQCAANVNWSRSIPAGLDGGQLSHEGLRIRAFPETSFVVLSLCYQIRARAAKGVSTCLYTTSRLAVVGT